MSARMPVVFVPHGGGPWPFVETGFAKQELEALKSGQKRYGEARLTIV